MNKQNKKSKKTTHKVGWTIYELRANEKFAKVNPCYFDKDWLRFFGEKLSESYVYKNTEYITDNYSGKERECFCVRHVHHNAPTLEQRTAYHYFDFETFERVFPKK